MKKLLAILLALCLLCGCQKGPDAAQVCEALCRLYISADSAVSEVLSGWDTESVRNTVEEGLYQQLSENLQTIGAGEPDEQLLQAVTEEMMAARSRIPVSVSLSEESEERAVLTVKLGSLDISAIDAAAAEEALSAMNGAAEDSDAYRQQLVEAYLEALQTGLVEFDGSGEESTIQVEFVKTEGLWVPADMQGFIEELGKAIRR